MCNHRCLLRIFLYQLVLLLLGYFLFLSLFNATTMNPAIVFAGLLWSTITSALTLSFYAVWHASSNKEQVLSHPYGPSVSWKSAIFYITCAYSILAGFYTLITNGRVAYSAAPYYTIPDEQVVQRINKQRLFKSRVTSIVSFSAAVLWLVSTVIIFAHGVVMPMDMDCAEMGSHFPVGEQLCISGKAAEVLTPVTFGLWFITAGLSILSTCFRATCDRDYAPSLS
ncbi:hypothetical protein GQ42DRAFT_47788 [Ramicandelaber brevisporus]|nr:hypothetical protein GQ42DRAFT_47788 [Ramicandelaber brevisporus]